MSGKYRISAFGGDATPFDFLKLEPDHGYADGCYLYLDELRPVRLIWTDAELNDFYLPNGNFRAGIFESLSYLTDDTVARDGSNYTLPAVAQPPSETRAAPELDLVGSAFSNMPARRLGYISRAQLEQELTGVLEDDRHPVVTLQGRGGIGKTSLALQVLHQLAEEGKVFAIVWFSARDIDLLPHGPQIVRPDVLSIADMASDFARLMRPNETLKELEAHQYLSDCLSGAAPDGPFIFIVDNFETVRDPAELYSFMSNSVRLPNKVLITTRTRDFKADYPVEVHGMAPAEFHELVSEASDRLRVDHLVDREYEEDLYVESDGHPYIAKVLLGALATSGRRESFKRLAASNDAMLDALFDRTFEALSPASKRVFLTLCAWRSVVPEVGLRAVLMRSANERLDVERALVELEQSSLVEVLTKDAADARFLAVPLAAALFGKRRLVTSPYKIAIDADLDLIHRFGAVRSTEIAQGLLPRVDRVVREAARRASDGLDISDELEVIRYIAAEYSPAWMLLAQLYEEVGDRPQAVTALNRYLELHPKDLAAWRRVIELHRAVGDHMAELHARLQLCELSDSTLDELSATVSRVNGWLYRRQLDLDADERRLTIGRFRALFEAQANDLDATDLSRLAWLCMNAKDASAALQWARQGLELDPANEHCQRLVERLESES